MQNAVACALGIALAALGVGCSEPYSAQAEPELAIPAIAAGGSVSFVGFSHSCAIVDGGLQCWGANGDGQLGDGFVTVQNPLPAVVVGLGGEVSAIAAGGAHSCAVVAGVAMCWGKNDRRQLAADRPAVVPEPAAVMGLPAPVTAIAAGGEHSCAVADEGLFCWGRGTHGELGRIIETRCGGFRASELCSSTPLRVTGLTGRIADVALGEAHSCAVADGRVLCWGRNNRGQLGDGTTADRAAPTAVVGIEREATAVAAGARHSCAVVAGGVMCWGAGGRGQLGDGSMLDRSQPVAVRGLESGVGAIAVGAYHSCALAGGTVRCWGFNRDGQLGGNTTHSPVPIAVEGLAEEVTALSAGLDQTCAVLAGERVACWGDNDFGQLGNGTISRPSRRPVAVRAWDRGGLRDRNADGVFTVACIGDSNTQAGFRFAKTWCERLETLLADPAWATLNRGWSGATAIALPSLRRADEQLTYTLEFDDVDAVILALGTNDILLQADPEDIVMAYLRHTLRARESGVDAFVALTPPAPGKSRERNAAIEATNDLIRRSVAPRRVVDFWSGFSGDDFIDEIHLNEAGHEKRARAALAALRPDE